MKEWEDLCRRCGQCCYDHYYTNGGRKLVIRTDSPCRFLDVKTRLCTVYAERFRRCSECRKVTILHALFSPRLPPDCGYVQLFRIWRRSSKRPLPG